jgi:hypothetical protein
MNRQNSENRSFRWTSAHEQHGLKSPAEHHVEIAQLIALDLLIA